MLKYQGYEINGFTFYTKSKMERAHTKIFHDENDNVQATYYGIIEEIWELEYDRLKAAIL